MRAHPRSGFLMRAHPVIPSKSSIWITYPGQINLAIAVNLWLIANQKFSFLIYCLRFRSLKELTYGNFLPCMLNLSRFFTVQLSRFCICTRLFIRYIRRRILLIFVVRFTWSAWLYYHDAKFLSTLFYIFFNQASGEGGIWTLAPVPRPIPLAGAPLRPLEYFSKVFT